MDVSSILHRAAAVSVTTTSLPDRMSERIGRYRWKICALLFFATTINYIDRQAVALLKPVLQDPVSGIGLTEVNYGYIVTAFSLAYALGLLVVGGFIDRVGTKIGYAVAVAVWALAAASHALISLPSVVAALNGAIHFLSGALGWKGLVAVPGAVAGFAVARFVLGLGESGNFPACIKTVAEWFPQKERALSTGIFNSGANVAALIAPLAVPWIAIHLGWRWGFLFTGIFSAIWIVFWWRIYRQPHHHPKVSPAELRHINSAPLESPPELATESATESTAGSTTKISWLHLLSKRQAWAIFVGKILTDPVWWFYLYWLPGFLNRRYGLPIGRIGLPLVVIYNMSAVGSIYGGWLPGKFLSLGWSANRARKTAMLIYAIAVLPVVFVGRMQGVWSVVALLSLATAAHQAWSANMFTLASDMFPRRAVASVVGLGTSGAALLMAFISTLVGYVLKWTNGNYAPLFVVCGTGYLTALLVIQLLAPNLKRAELNS
jgi:ACS family hexuronate transporter-like MFS transporter